MPLLRTVLACLLAIVSLPSHASDGPRLLFTGDILLSRQVAQEIARSGLSPWHNLQPLLTEADWLVGNLEGALGKAADCAGKPATLCFAVSPESLTWLQQAGFTALGLANNHSTDLGPAGLVATQLALAQAGIATLDDPSSPRFFERDGLTLGVVALPLVPDANAPHRSLPDPDLARRLRLARRLANLVVVLVHWGYELQDWPSPEQQQQARWLVAQGADLIIGHHPHVVQPPACVAGRPVFYSLGNHLFDQKYPLSKHGLLADCRIQNNRLHCAALRTLAPPGSSYPHLAKDPHAFAETLDTCTPPLTPSLQVNGYTLTPVHDGKRLRLQAWRDGQRRWQTPALPLLALEHGNLANADEDLLLTLERRYSTLDHAPGVRPYVYALTPNGLLARWRGSALAWPLLDAVLLPGQRLCALHRGDNFLVLNPTTTLTRTLVYTWNGFGFSAAHEAAASAACAAYFEGLAKFPAGLP